jgi:hypothetical protein
MSVAERLTSGGFFRFFLEKNGESTSREKYIITYLRLTAEAWTGPMGIR